MWPFAGLLSATPPVTHEAYNGAATLLGTEDSPDNPYVILRYDSDGGIRYTRTEPTALNTFNNGEWSSDHPNETGGASYSIRISHQSGSSWTIPGDGINPMVLNTWYNLSVNRQIKFTRSTIGSGSGVYLLELSDDGGSSVLDSATVTISLNKQTP